MYFLLYFLFLYIYFALFYYKINDICYPYFFFLFFVNPFIGKHISFSIYIQFY
ncbi:hypothetical protein H8356DRAFT_1724257 [Neocallimastix lanati (nom. inval.)]|nr:hypothetical protein H8356DRAFT_1724257 [Neocallimastix sp. JGI-2020a]